jgi:hypothetical protein
VLPKVPFIAKLIQRKVHHLLRLFSSHFQQLFNFGSGLSILSSNQSSHLWYVFAEISPRLSRLDCFSQNVQYFVMFIDQATRYMWIIFVVDVTTQSMIAAFDQFYIKVQQAQEVIGELHILKTFKTDCASSFKDEAFVSHLSARGVKPEYSAPNSHYQNSLAE